MGSKAYTDVRSCCPVSTVRALVPKKAEVSEYQISKPPCGSRSSPMPVSWGECGGGRGAKPGAHGGGGEGGTGGGEGGEGQGGGGGSGGKGGECFWYTVYSRSVGWRPSQTWNAAPW